MKVIMIVADNDNKIVEYKRRFLKLLSVICSSV